MILPDIHVAMIYKHMPQYLGFGGYLQRGMEQVCQVKHFFPGDEQAGFDWYLYVDDGPTDYMEPKHHPAVFFAIDMVVKPFWYLQPVEVYFQRFQNFDRGAVSSTASMQYCHERGYPARLVGFAADPGYHAPLGFAVDWDWVAAWHNTGERVAAVEAATKRYPHGHWVWAGENLYAAYISRARCALNWLRGDIVNMRVFEVAACRVPLITTRHPDMAVFGFHEDEHYLGYDAGDIDGMLDKIGWVQEHLGEAEQMAIRAQRHVLTCHTYYQRALEIVEWLTQRVS